MDLGKRILKLLCRTWRRATGTNTGLETEVSATLPVLEVLESQILDVIKKGNDATDKLSTSFGDMAGRANDVVNMATGAQRDESRAGVDEVREIVSELLVQVQRTSESTQETAEMLSKIEIDLQNVEECMAEIEGIANRSRMVSLNGQIEAAAAGENGHGFAVVASETGDLATNVSEVSHRIRGVVDQMSQSIRKSFDRTRSRVTADQDAIKNCEQRVEEMLTSLDEYQQELERNLESTKSSSDELASAISQSVMTLQFQDSVSQRMHHVTETMNEIRETFGTLVDPADSGAAKRRSEEWMEKLTSSYCVNEEHAVFSGASATELELSESSNVELF